MQSYRLDQTDKMLFVTANARKNGTADYVGEKRNHTGSVHIMLRLWHVHMTAFAIEICNITFSLVLSRYRIFKNKELVSSSMVKSPRRIFLGIFAENKTPLLSQPIYGPNLSPQTSSYSQNRNLV